MAKEKKSIKEKKESLKNSKALKILKIIKNTIFIVLLLALVSIIVITLTAKINGETPTLFGFTLYRVSSGSMVPYLQVGDVILCRECDPMTLQKGDIITFNGTSGSFAGKRVTHRVVKEPYLNQADGEYYLLTKGDDNPIEDTPITISQVTGKFQQKVEFLKAIYDFFITPWGLLTILALIILAFSNEIVIFAKAIAGHNDDEEEDIQEIIERVQREDAEKQRQELHKYQKDKKE